MTIKIAWRNIWRNKIRSLIIIVSVSSGLLAGMAVISLYEGMMRSRVRTVIETETGHIQIHQKNFLNDRMTEYYIPNPQLISDHLKNDMSVRAFSERTISEGMLSTASGVSGVSIIGILPQNEIIVSGLDQKIKEGFLIPREDINGILIGKKLSQKLKIHLGQKIILTVTDSAGNLTSSAFRLRGIYQSDNALIDEVNVYVSQQSIQAMLTLKNQIHEISVLLKSDEQMDECLRRYKIKFPDLAIDSWKSLSPETNLLVTTVDYYSFIILVILFIAISFGIMNTMMMSVLERRYETGMMMALGMGKYKIMYMIILETIFLSIISIPVIIPMALMTIQYYGEKGIDLSGMGKDMMYSFGFETTIYPVFPIEKLPSLIILLFITAIISSILPTWKSVQNSPIQALRN
ncbi:MAG: ABC transporter permease [Ferruginibacter sp.]|nr:ABC transporter permease [Ferruginibacter sp.]